MKQNTDYHKPELKTTNFNGTFYRFCNCDTCCEERGTSAGNLLDNCQYDDENPITDYKVTNTTWNLITGEPV